MGARVRNESGEVAVFLAMGMRRRLELARDRTQEA